MQESLFTAFWSTCVLSTIFPSPSEVGVSGPGIAALDIRLALKLASWKISFLQYNFGHTYDLTSLLIRVVIVHLHDNKMPLAYPTNGESYSI